MSDRVFNLRQVYGMIGPLLSVAKDTEYELNVIGVSILSNFHKSFHLICEVFQLSWKN